jgi:hypothetical protein
MVAARLRNGWIFSPAVDLAVFAGPVALAWALVAAFASAGTLQAPAPLWIFALVVVGCDVSHVWSTVFRAYADPDERARRPRVLAVTPLACFLAGLLLHALGGPALFWRVLAYVAVFHFVRQQWGWMAYAARRAGEGDRVDRWLDRLAIDAATLGPLVWWHTRLPRAFAWFRAGDFVPGLPPVVGDVALMLHWGLLALWVARQAQRVVAGQPVNLAKALVLGTTWATWYGGIVWLDSDVAFTLTNVLAHGVPYLALVWWWGHRRFAEAPGARVAGLFRPAGVGLYVALLVAVAWVEEHCWDRLVWHDHDALFPGPAIPLGAFGLAAATALLAVPQATHYVLDGFLWRTRTNPDVAARLGLAGG